VGEGRRRGSEKGAKGALLPLSGDFSSPKKEKKEGGGRKRFRGEEEEKG